MAKRITRKEAKDLGLIIDNGQEPVAYRGPRFAPDEIHDVIPDVDVAAAEMLHQFQRWQDISGPSRPHCAEWLELVKAAEKLRETLDY